MSERGRMNPGPDLSSYVDLQAKRDSWLMIPGATFFGIQVTLIGFLIYELISDDFWDAVVSFILFTMGNFVLRWLLRLVCRWGVVWTMNRHLEQMRMQDAAWRRMREDEGD